jgi:hypothetical protein
MIVIKIINGAINHLMQDGIRISDFEYHGVNLSISRWLIDQQTTILCLLLLLFESLLICVGDILFGVAFFVLGQIFMLVLSVQICEAAKHYIDGLFFGTVCSLLAVMMVYKYWDSITKEDLEFSVGGKANVWEVREEYEAIPTEKEADIAYQRVQ